MPAAWDGVGRQKRGHRMATMAAAYPTRVTIDPAAPQRRLTVLFRFLLVIPHVVVLYVLGIVMSVVTITAWFAIVLTGSYPRGMYGFAVNVVRWLARVYGHVFLLTGDLPHQARHRRADRGAESPHRVLPHLDAHSPRVGARGARLRGGSPAPCRLARRAVHGERARGHAQLPGGGHALGHRFLGYYYLLCDAFIGSMQACSRNGTW